MTEPREAFVTKPENQGRVWRAAAGAAAVLGLLAWGGATGLAQDEGPPGGAQTQVEPDWPCAQRYVAELSWGAIWAGPDLTGALESWHDNTKLREIITYLSDDTVTEVEGVKRINEFADSLETTDKEKQLTELFAGLFETMSNQRTSAQAGIKRFFRRQERVAENVNVAGERLRKLDEKEVAHDDEKYVEAQQRLAWHTRVFDERQLLVPYMCEVPVVIERRLGTFARAINAQIEGEPMTPPEETASP